MDLVISRLQQLDQAPDIGVLAARSPVEVVREQDSQEYVGEGILRILSLLVSRRPFEKG